MQKVRFGFTLAVLAVCLFVATNPVFAAAGGNGNGNNGNGNGNGGNPGSPVLPEAPLAIVLPLAGIVIIGLAFFFIQRRRRTSVSK